MHEMALTRNVVDTVVEYAQKAGATKVHAVYMSIGYARDIVDDLFEGCFKYMAKGTVAEDAELVIYRVPVTVKCNRCGAVYPINLYRENTWPCPNCKVRDYVTNSGLEFNIDHIEVMGDGLNKAECRHTDGTRHAEEACVAD